MNPLLLSPQRFCNYIWHWAEQRVPAEAFDEWKAMMSSPLREVGGAARVPSDLELESETQDFASFYASVTSG